MTLLRSLQKLMNTGRRKNAVHQGPFKHRCHRCGGSTVKTRWRHSVTGKKLYACKGCGKTFLGQ